MEVAIEDVDLACEFQDADRFAPSPDTCSSADQESAQVRTQILETQIADLTKMLRFKEAADNEAAKTTENMRQTIEEKVRELSRKEQELITLRHCLAAMEKLITSLTQQKGPSMFSALGMSDDPARKNKTPAESSGKKYDVDRISSQEANYLGLSEAVETEASSPLLFLHRQVGGQEDRMSQISVSSTGSDIKERLKRSLVVTEPRSSNATREMGTPIAPIWSAV
eukprot:GEMP01052701.1.p1 GENE.GEMP01052701.1~~GEMP01052701.1.p1  ORF type:complete len:232 (+),score=50.63 GEMP01052701.1:23-697(+)